MTMTDDDSPLYVQLKTKWFEAFESGDKDVELRGVNSRFNVDTVRPGRPAKLVKGYNPEYGCLDGTVGGRSVFDDPRDIAHGFDPSRIVPGADADGLVDVVEATLGDYDEHIAFEVLI